MKRTLYSLHPDRWDYDVLICGGGVAGTALASKLVRSTYTKLKIGIVESRNPLSSTNTTESELPPDVRVYALAPKSIEFLKNVTGHPTWVQTSYNGNIRKNYAGVGYTYDSGRDAFIPPQPFPSWTLAEETCQWFAPVPVPAEGMCHWDESTTSWVMDSQ
jgi:hypothetical protein